ncbi:MAG: hypothetical protein OXD44_03790 [Gammaproteobacteria bacterium]|nr:hypothetical protein [Gammaproteobacteria bacterium]
MGKHLRNDGKTASATPSIDLLNRKLGTSPTPRMLTKYENGLLRQSALEISRVTIEVLEKNDDA